MHKGNPRWGGARSYLDRFMDTALPIGAVIADLAGGLGGAETEAKHLVVNSSGVHFHHKRSSV